MAKQIPAKDRRRLMALVAQWCELSKLGWRNAEPEDWLPLERELLELERKYGASKLIYEEINNRRRAYILNNLRCRYGGMAKDCQRPECSDGTCNGGAPRPALPNPVDTIV